MKQNAGSMVVLAIFVSRFEAIVIASMLRGYGFHVLVDGDAHASVEFMSMAFGGHRLRVMREDYQAASDVLRQSGAADGEAVYAGPSSALIKLVALAVGLHALAIVPVVIAGSITWLALFYIPFVLYTLPVDPKGPPDYFLAESAD